MDIIFGVDIEHVCLHVLFQSYYRHKYGDNKNLAIKRDVCNIVRICTLLEETMLK